MATTDGLCKLVNEELQGLRSFLFFDGEDHVLATSLQVTELSLDMESLKGAFRDGRESAVKNGIKFDQKRFEVHRYDPPLIYGRTMSGDPLHSEAIAVHLTEDCPQGKPVYAVITFALPELTAKKVPELKNFCRLHLKAHAVDGLAENTKDNGNQSANI